MKNIELDEFDSSPYAFDVLFAYISSYGGSDGLCLIRFLVF